MKASAPGKLVISGAYAVLVGAPALVTAVDRRVYAETGKNAIFDAPEVSEGISLLEKKGPVAQRPWYDAQELRESNQKLGLGSSAAICVASLALLLAEQLLQSGSQWTQSTLKTELYPLALKAHRQAQGGGSGIDVAAACFGRTLSVTRASDVHEAQTLKVAPAFLPSDLVVEVWSSPLQASTSQLVRKVFSSEKRFPTSFRAAMTRQADASEKAAHCLKSQNSHAFVIALREQHEALLEIGKLARTAIVLPAISELQGLLPEQACLLPSGAGGGDVNLYIGPWPSNSQFRRRASELQLEEVSLSLDAPGLTLEPHS